MLLVQEIPINRTEQNVHKIGSNMSPPVCLFSYNLSYTSDTFLKSRAASSSQSELSACFYSSMSKQNSSESSGALLARAPSVHSVVGMAGRDRKQWLKQVPALLPTVKGCIFPSWNSELLGGQRIHAQPLCAGWHL